jgi:hypothetical protein
MARLYMTKFFSLPGTMKLSLTVHWQQLPVMSTNSSSTGFAYASYRHLMSVA